MSSLDLDNPEKYAVEPEAEVFDEHVRYKADPQTGKPTSEVLKRFTKTDLEAYAAGNNQRDKEGAPPAMTIGHTSDDGPEDQQPRIVGYWRKHRVDWSDAKQRWVLKAVPYVKREHLEEARTYPRVSVEAWKTRMIMDPIAILRRTPDRPTQWTFSARTADRYKMTPAKQERYRYAMEAPMSPAAPDTGLDPTGDPSASIDQDFADKFSRCMQQMYPQMQAMHQKFAAEAQAPLPAGGPPAPGADPMSQQTPAAPPATPPEPSAERFSALEAEIKTLRDQNAGLDKKLRQRERKADLEKLATRFQMDVAVELADCEDLPADKYAAHLKRIERYVPKAVDPADPAAMIDTTGPAGDKGAEKFSAAHAASAEAYQRKHHARLQQYPAEERAERAMKFAVTGKEE